MNAEWVRTGSCLALLAFIGACYVAPIKHEYEIAPGQGFNPGFTTVLVLPLNETMEVESGLEQGIPATNEAIDGYLESKGLVVERLTSAEYKKAMTIAAAHARESQLSGESGSVSENLAFADAVPPLLEELGSEADLIVTSNMVIRSGAYAGGSQVKWDGVRRRERGSGGGMSGGTSAASLFTVIYDREGTRIFSGYGGLDLLFQVNVRKRRYDLREDRLLDTENIQEGVCVSFHPFFGLEESCRPK